MSALEFVDVVQGSPEWLALRKTKITATDAPIIMGVSPWKTKLRLYKEKKDLIESDPVTDRMKRGTELEPVARQLFNLTFDLDMQPAVAIRGWAMASLDGIIPSCTSILEIKCPGDEVHSMAKAGIVPEYYYPQIQHQLFVVGAKMAYYYSFDGFEGQEIVVERDNDYIDKMLEEEVKFYDCLYSNTPPEPEDRDYVSREDDEWVNTATGWIEVNRQIKSLQEYEESLRQELIRLSGENSCIGGGISTSKVTRKGLVNYAIVPQLKGVDLEPYRKAPSSSWRILKK